MSNGFEQLLASRQRSPDLVAITLRSAMVSSSESLRRHFPALPMLAIPGLAPAADLGGHRRRRPEVLYEEGQGD
eukprot:5906043-Alexandrium_andersonii.AAC.1